LPIPAANEKLVEADRRPHLRSKAAPDTLCAVFSFHYHMFQKMNPEHVVIAGAQKCGTTTLFEWLAIHPAIGTAVDWPSQTPRKELDFFGGANWSKGFDWYVDQFLNHEKRSLDASPEYMTHANAPARIAKVFPKVQVIVTLREPISRAISQHNHYLQQFPNTANWDWRCPGKDFAINVSAELDEPYELWRGMVGRGMYAQQLVHWSKIIPRSQMCVIILEEWQHHPMETLHQLLDFLGLERIYPTNLKPHHQRMRRLPSIPCATIQALSKLYENANEQLFNWLGREIPAWQKFYSHGS
jgi:hypothetical protein